MRFVILSLAVCMGFLSRPVLAQGPPAVSDHFGCPDTVILEAPPPPSVPAEQVIDRILSRLEMTILEVVTESDSTGTSEPRGRRSLSEARLIRLHPLVREVGVRTSATGRVAYWCIADEAWRIADRAPDCRTRRVAEATARDVEALGPTREQHFLDRQAGQTVTASLGAYGSCVTRVR